MKRLLVVFVLVIVLALAIAATGIFFAVRGGDGPVLATPSRVLVWEMDRPVVEWEPEVPLLLSGGVANDTLGRLYRTLRAAREDDSVAALAVHVRETVFGLARAQELRRQLTALSRAGKPVWCYLETAGDGGNGTLPYYLATACDRIYLSPAGELAPVGLFADAVFFGGTLEKLRVDTEYDHVGRFKGAGETFTRRGLSDSTRRALEALLDSDFRQIVAAVAEARGLEEGRVREIVDGAPYGPDEALALGLVDAVAYPDRFREDLLAAVAGEDGAEPAEVDLREYRGGDRWSRRGGHTVAVVFAVGTIVRGAGGSSPLTDELFLGSDDLGDLLEELREDGSVDAVVLRVDSPGGSALASDLILRQVELLAAEKTVVVSMSDVAASGGYYIAARAHRIVAEGATVTGSIGVVGGKLVTARFQEEVLGITHDTLQRGANAGLYSTLTTYTPEQRRRVRRSMERVYDLFVSHVAEGRGMAEAEVRRVAQGRVWSGEDAQRHGLVDELGGLDRALEVAREEAGIGPAEGVRLLFLPREPTWLEIFSSDAATDLPAHLPPAAKRLLASLDRPSPGLLELPPELASLAAPF